MSVTVRSMRPEDAGRFLEIQGDAVRGLAAKDYPPSVIEAWAAPLTPQFMERFLANPDREIRLIAELDGHSAGIGAIVVDDSELRACYVDPSAARRGVGRALVVEIERIAREHQLDHLHLEASITAEPFYLALGYQVERRHDFFLRAGVPMSAVQMRKRL
jgi:putative acetyltransferase